MYIYVCVEPVYSLTADEMSEVSIAVCISCASLMLSDSSIIFYSLNS